MKPPAITLYGLPVSLYTGKARSYLLKNDLNYQEVSPSSRRFGDEVLPRAGTLTLPTIETEDGLVIRDGTRIVDHYESLRGEPCTPKGPRQRVVNALLDVIGMEGLLRPAMHYRWNFPDENEDFIAFHFRMLAPAGRDPDTVARQVMDRMRGAAVAFGVTPEAIPGIETRYRALLEVLDRHFRVMPYLLGGRPCTGDFSWIAPMYAHLGRDPKPLSILQKQAFHVFRWVERMNRPEADRCEYVEDGEPMYADAFIANDEIPDTLIAVLQQVAIDFVPETIAAAELINGWLSEQGERAAGEPVERGLGLARFTVGGVAMHGLAQPHRFYLLQRVQAAYDALSTGDQAQVERTLEACHLLPVLDARLTRSLRFQENVEIWD